MKIDWNYLKRHYTTDLKAKSIWDRFYGTTPRVSYDLFGTVTGRLSTKQGSFPILNYKKELRGAIRPKWDCFVELDYNAAEVRTLLSLSGEQQPKEIFMSLTPLTYLMMKQQERMQNENSLHGSTTPPLKVYDQTTMIEMKYSNNPLMEIGSKLLLIGKLALTASTLLIIAVFFQ